MPSDRLTGALARLDRAVGRLETLALAPPPAATPSPDLERRHAALRAATAEALTRLDRLIAAEGR